MSVGPQLKMVKESKQLLRRYGKKKEAPGVCGNVVDDSPPFSEEQSDHVIMRQLRLTFSSRKPGGKTEKGGLASALTHVVQPG